MEELSFKEVQQHLMEKFLRDAPSTETDEELGQAFLDLILQSERLRHGVRPSDPKQDEVDRQTLDCLYSQTELGPEHYFAESIFKRLAVDPGSAMRHFRQAIEQQSIMQAKRAKSPRPRRYDSITKLINDIVVDDPTITTKAVLEELALMDGIVIADGEIRNTQDQATMQIKNLASRVTDARNRVSG
ncbi:MAG: hypothetical protein RL404_53 [Pseudomonadota bacterium]|jgi:hypothetical protein